MSRIVIALLISVFGISGVHAQADSRLKRMSDSKIIKIAYRADAAPYSFINEKKEAAGYSVDLCKGVVESINRQLGTSLKIEWVQVTIQTRFQAVASGHADMECGASTITLGRMGGIDFSNAIFVETTGVLVKSGAGIKSALDLSGKKIAVIAGTTNERALANLMKSGKFNPTLVPVQSREEGIAALEKDAADAYASDKLLLLGAKVSDPKALTILADDLSFEPYGIVLPRGDADLRLAVNRGLAQSFGSGQIAVIFRKWFGQLGLKPGPLMLSVFALGALSE